jgi:hypothetical protein
MPLAKKSIKIKDTRQAHIVLRLDTSILILKYEYSF